MNDRRGDAGSGFGEAAERRRTDADAGRTEEDWLWLCSIRGLYDPQKKALLSYFGSPGAVRTAGREDLRPFEQAGLGWIRYVYPALQDEYMKRVRETLARQELQFISHENPLFPGKLRHIADCPCGLFLKGEMRAESAALRVGVVGARLCSPRGEYFTAALGRILAQAGVEVISGMAAGIDGTAQLAALHAGGYSVGVLGCGADICYPAENIGLYRMLAQKGCLVSEFPPGSSPRRIHFPLRNRIISGMCDALIVVEAREKSGSLITAGYALDQGREVYAADSGGYESLNRGCLALIEDGASAFREPEEILDLLKLRFPEALQVQRKTEKAAEEFTLAKQDELVYSNLDLSPAGISDLTARTGLQAGQVAESLMTLQLMKLAAEAGKNKYIRTNIFRME